MLVYDELDPEVRTAPCYIRRDHKNYLSSVSRLERNFKTLWVRAFGTHTGGGALVRTRGMSPLAMEDSSQM